MNKQWNRKGRRGIEYVDYTNNPMGGCIHDCEWIMPNGDRAECYAKTVAEGIAAPAYPDGFRTHYWKPEALNAPHSVKTPAIIFENSMSDLFGAQVPDDQIKTCLGAFGSTPRHTHLVLTKNPGRLLKFAGDFPRNVWPGVSMPPDFMNGSELTLDQKRRYMKAAGTSLATMAARFRLTTWISFEPLSWDVGAVMEDLLDRPGNGPFIKWAVIGPASRGNTYFQPNPDHVKRLLAALDAAGVPVFFKGSLDWEPRREDYPVVPEWDQAIRERERNARRNGWTLNRNLEKVEYV